jgi:uncharacterized protein
LKVYLDSSAVGKLLLDEPEADAIAELVASEVHTFLSSDLLETELRRIAVREQLPQTAVSELLLAVNLHELARSLYLAAGVLPDPLRTLDALHLAAAMRLDADAILTYDTRLASAAESHGLAVLQP